MQAHCNPCSCGCKELSHQRKKTTKIKIASREYCVYATASKCQKSICWIFNKMSYISQSVGLVIATAHTLYRSAKLIKPAN